MSELVLKPGERLDHLLAEDLRIIQSREVFSFSFDAVLLADFAKVPKHKAKIVDLCSGNGVIPLLLSSKTKAPMTGVEIQERLYDMATRSIQFNNLSDQIEMCHLDLKQAPALLGIEKTDIVTCNPPYFNTYSQEIINKNEHYAIARHEILCTLEDVVQATSRLLKQGGKAYFVHRPNRLMDLITYMKKYRLEPKRIQFIYPREGKDANTLLVEGIKDGQPDVKILPPINVYESNGEYSSFMKRLLYGEES